MGDIFSKALKLLVGTNLAEPAPKAPKKRAFNDLTERELIQLESRIGAAIFGDVAKGCRREFFNEDPKNWIWYEQTIGPDGKKVEVTTRYEVHDNGILKVRSGEPYHFIAGEELRNLSMAVQLYYERVMRDIYKRDVVTKK